MAPMSMDAVANHSDFLPALTDAASLRAWFVTVCLTVLMVMMSWNAK